MVENFEDVEAIKLIDCPMYKEFSVVILFANGKTKIKELSTSKEANELYNQLMLKFDEHKSCKDAGIEV